MRVVKFVLAQSDSWRWIMRRRRTRVLLLSTLILVVQIAFPLKVSGTEVQSVETQGTIGFTGVYEPIGTPDPKPPGNSERPPITEVAKPDGRLPQTNDAGNSLFIWVGVFMLSFVFLLWKRKKEQD